MEKHCFKKKNEEEFQRKKNHYIKTPQTFLTVYWAVEVVLMERSRKKPGMLKTRPKTTKDETRVRTTLHRQETYKSN